MSPTLHSIIVPYDDCIIHIHPPESNGDTLFSRMTRTSMDGSIGNVRLVFFSMKLESLSMKGVQQGIAQRGIRSLIARCAIAISLLMAARQKDTRRQVSPPQLTGMGTTGVNSKCLNYAHKWYECTVLHAHWTNVA